MDAILQTSTRDDEAFVDFGSDPFYPYPLPQLERVHAKRQEQLRLSVRQQCPKVPGVYGMLDRQQRLIYVGKSKALRSRLLSYFLPTNADDKAGRIVESARHIVWETQPSEFAALLREQQLIRRWTPRWNVQGIPKRQRPVYLCLGRGPAATFYLSRLPVFDAIACEGPFHGASRMGRAVEVLNKFYQLRDCSSKQKMRFADQLQLFDNDERPGCLRYEIGTCLGPCVGGCSREKYQRQVNAAAAFLSGAGDEPVVAMQTAMAAAALRQQYELAQCMRDDLRALEYLHRKLTLLAESRKRCHFVYATTAGQRSVWYLIVHGEVSDAVAAPSCPRSFADTKPKLREWQKRLEQAAPQLDAPFTYTLPLVAAWFRKNPQEYERTFSPSLAGRCYRALARAT